MSFVIIKNLVQREMLVVFKKNKKTKKPYSVGFLGWFFEFVFLGGFFLLNYTLT
jgi:hypothetical protein